MNLFISERITAVITALILLLSLGQIISYTLTLLRDIQALPIAKTTARRSANSTIESKNEEAKSAISDPTCQLLVKNATVSSDHQFYRAVHESQFPACAAGTWTYRPDLVVFPSEEHLICLDREVQGNCHDPSSWVNASDGSPKLSRHKSILKNMVGNSPGILNASDPWMWHSDLEQYQTVPYGKNNQDEYRERIRKLLLHPEGRTIYFVGDSLTRQWQHSMKCEIVHVLGISDQKAEKIVQFLGMYFSFDHGLVKRYVAEATERDYVVFNVGHHIGKKLGDDWHPQYTSILKTALSWDFGKIPDSHIFFRTTSIRHFKSGMGDWNTDSSQAGAMEPNMKDGWSEFGGNSPELPIQNLIAFDVFLGNTTNRKFRILDTSPMMLARADASFDGAHFCLPGPMEDWSRMLYYQIEQDEIKSARRNN